MCEIYADPFQRSLMHLSSVLATGNLFALCTREVYMSDLDDFPGQAIALQALQSIAKAES